MATKKEKKTAVVAQPPKDEDRTSLGGQSERARKLLFMLAEKLRKFAELEDVSKLKIKYEESKPLKSVYTEDSPHAVGFIEQGPRVVSFVIEDYTNDGKLKGIG